MATIARVPVEWNGLGGLPGVSVFYWDFSTAADLSALNTFFTAIRSFFPTGLSWDIPGSGDNIDDTSGTLNGSWIATGAGQITANGGVSGYAAGVGARVRWDTGAIVDGRRVRGSTFLVPLLADSYDGTGSINNTDLAALQSAVNDLNTNGGLLIWSRNDPGSTNGESNAVVSGNVPDRISTLRTRRT